MNKLKHSLKYLYVFIFIGCLVWLVTKIFITNKTEYPTITNIISAVIILLLLYFFIIFLLNLITAIIGLILKRDSIQKNKYKSEILYCLFGLFIVFSVWAGINLVSSFYDMDIPSFTFRHFRTNIFTGQCNYGGESGYIESNQWYYKPDCKLEQKIKISKKEGFYQQRVTECTNYCETTQKDYFCNTHYVTVGNAWGNGPENLFCDEIIECTKINCVEHRNFRETNKTAPLQ